MKQAAFLLSLVILTNGAQKNVRRDGSWWLSISAGEQESYLLGYGDCYVDSLRSKRPPYIEDRKLSQLMSASYLSGKAKSSELVSAVMKSVWAANVGKTAPPRRAAGGETWTEPHGYFDGLWWKGGSAAEKLGFVEGETDCFNQEPASQVRFPLPAPNYVKWLDEAYGLVPNSSAPRSSEDAQIADVLLRKGERITK